MVLYFMFIVLVLQHVYCNVLVITLRSDAQTDIPGSPFTVAVTAAPEIAAARCLCRGLGITQTVEGYGSMLKMQLRDLYYNPIPAQVV